MALLAHTFGVRHFSPAGALHLRRFLEEKRPVIVFIEGPSDATNQLKHLVHEKTRPPVAVLAFTKTRPVRTIVCPMASYSPEWIALRWALENRREVRFIDLPAAVFIEMHKREEQAALTAAQDAPPSTAHSDDTRAYLDDPYEALAKLSGEVDHETWWERHFEHTRDIAAYQQSLHEFGG